MTKHDSDFIDWIEDYRSWYEKHGRRWCLVLECCGVLSLLAAIFTIVVAAAIPSDSFSAGGRWLIVAASVLSALPAAILSQLKARDMMEARESAHLEIERLLAYAKQKFDEFSDDRERINRIKDEIRENIDKLERDQLSRYTAIRTKTDEAKPAN